MKTTKRVRQNVRPTAGNNLISGYSCIDFHSIPPSVDKPILKKIVPQAWVEPIYHDMEKKIFATIEKINAAKVAFDELSLEERNTPELQEVFQNFASSVVTGSISSNELNSFSLDASQGCKSQHNQKASPEKTLKNNRPFWSDYSARKGRNPIKFIEDEYKEEIAAGLMTRLALREADRSLYQAHATWISRNNGIDPLNLPKQPRTDLSAVHDVLEHKRAQGRAAWTRFKKKPMITNDS